MGGYVSFFNASGAFSDAELQNALPDFQSQLSNEYQYYWGLSAYLDINGGGTPIYIVDYPGANDPQGALGYHFIDGNYQPYAVIFAGLCRDYGYSTTGVISHELLEMLADTEVDTVNLIDNGNGTGLIVIQEVCDPCEMSLYYEGPNGNVVSDFALPGWWVPGYPGQVDFLGQIPGPLQLLSGGYISYQTVTLSGWQQVNADQAQKEVGQAAQALRSRIASAGNPRAELAMRLRRGQNGAPDVLATGPKGLDGSQSRQQQVAAPTGKVTVVKRADVPTLTSGQAPKQRAYPSASDAKQSESNRAASGVKAQIIDLAGASKVNS